MQDRLSVGATETCYQAATISLRQAVALTLRYGPHVAPTSRVELPSLFFEPGEQIEDHTSLELVDTPGESEGELGRRPRPSVGSAPKRPRKRTFGADLDQATGSASVFRCTDECIVPNGRIRGFQRLPPFIGTRRRRASIVFPVTYFHDRSLHSPRRVTCRTPRS